MADIDDEMQRVFRDLPYQLKRELAGEVRETAQWLADQVEEAAPQGESGHTKASVRVERGRGTLEFVVKAGGPLTTKPVRDGASVEYDYAMGGEFGTQHQDAAPWFYPTCRSNIAEANQRLADKAEQTIGSPAQRSVVAGLVQSEAQRQVRHAAVRQAKRLLGSRTVDAAEALHALSKGAAGIAEFAAGKARHRLVQRLTHKK